MLTENYSTQHRDFAFIVFLGFIFHCPINIINFFVEPGELRYHAKCKYSNTRDFPLTGFFICRIEQVHFGYEGVFHKTCGKYCRPWWDCVLCTLTSSDTIIAPGTFNTFKICCFFLWIIMGFVRISWLVWIRFHKHFNMENKRKQKYIETFL